MGELAEAKVKRIDPVGKTIYGDSFTFFNRIAEIVDLIPAFKEFYYQERIKDKNATISEMLRQFNAQACEPMDRKFHPSMSQMRVWRKKWDLDLMQQAAGKELSLDEVEKKNVQQVIKTRNDERAIVVGMPSDNELEGGLRTLGGELMNDALQMLRDDQELDEIYDDDTLIKRRNYIVNVFGHVTKLVHGKAALMLKASEEKRNNAGFLIGLLSRAQAGTIKPEEMEILKSAYAPKPNGTPTHV